MAHALQRISFATCDPEFRLFAYMSHNPSPLGTAIHCHVFMTKHTREVRTSIIIIILIGLFNCSTVRRSYLNQLPDHKTGDAFDSLLLQ